MQAPFWKRLLSYLVEFHIEGSSSDYNPQLDVCLVRGRYQLCTENAIYSFGDLYNNFTDAFQKVNLEQLPGSSVLVLGFGMGSIPVILEKKMRKSFQYTGIEIDEEVIYLASKYVLDKLNSSIAMICADAGQWVYQSEQQFDLIAIDLFLDDVIPKVFEEKDFLEQVKSLLHPNGLLLYNRLAYLDNDVEKSKQFYKEQFQPVFPKGTYMALESNWMLVNDEKWLLDNGKG